MPPAPTAIPGTAVIRLGIALLGAIGFALSYDALRQMAVAVHVRGPLTYAFPLVIDGFIAIGVGALLILRTAPLHSRLYVWALVGLATTASIWANALHAVRLNTLPRSADGLRLDNVTVGVLSAIAPLALAGAVHLYLVIRRYPALVEAPGADALPRHIAPGHRHNSTSSAQPHALAEDEPGLPGSAEASLDVAEGPRHVAHDAVNVAEAPEPPTGPEDQQPGATFDDLLAIGRTAPAGRGGRVSRRNVEAAIRSEGHPIGKDRLTQVKDHLQAELDEAAPLRQARPAKAPIGSH